MAMASIVSKLARAALAARASPSAVAGGRRRSANAEAPIQKKRQSDLAHISFLMRMYSSPRRPCGLSMSTGANIA
ncbi:hypothetical protein BRADI_2g40139v3 [Brachypodium distachyon]|uniref:Uncharacterized protein n=1 Tax=Brachypodium distachyon TaxID=15368 RepID=A0A2K2DCZ7_BRADI|nr:hypothetical protein BRADI_2g40139v3 [Brachypodium distachyon]